MSSTLSFTPNTYAGELAGGYVSRALLGAKSLSQGLVTILPNVKKRAILRGIEQEVIFQDASADFSADGNTLLDERYLDPVEMSVMYELKFRDLLQSWEASQLKPGANGDIPTDLAEFLIERMQAKINLGVEKLIWQGKTGGEFTFSSAYPGLLSLINASTDTAKITAVVGQLAIQGITIASNAVVTVSSTATLNTGDRVTIVGANAATLVGGSPINGQSFTITVLNGTTFSLGATTTGTATGAAGNVQFINASNVVEVLTAIYNNTPDAVKHQPDFVLFVPMHVADAYRVRQATVANGAGTYFSTDKQLNFLGKNMQEMPCFNTNTIVGARTSNLYFGTDLEADFNQIQVVDMRQSTADQKVRYRANFASDVNMAYPQEVVIYRPA